MKNLKSYIEVALVTVGFITFMVVVGILASFIK
jgi:hypothetical protein